MLCCTKNLVVMLGDNLDNSHVSSTNVRLNFCDIPLVGTCWDANVKIFGFQTVVSQFQNHCIDTAHLISQVICVLHDVKSVSSPDTHLGQLAHCTMLLSSNLVLALVCLGTSEELAPVLKLLSV